MTHTTTSPHAPVTSSRARRILRAALAGALCAAVAVVAASGAPAAFAAPAAAAAAASTSTSTSAADTDTAATNTTVFPPWQHGRNNDALHRGLEFTVPQVDVLADFHGDLSAPKLVLFVGGNYFFAMAPLVAQFEQDHPEFRGKIFWETIPPGLLVTQIKAGGTITVGNMTWTVKPDAYFAGLSKVNELIADGTLTGPAVPYVTNQLTIMVRAGNPARIASLNDLAKPGLRLAMPNPEFEGVARQIRASLVKAGGDGLARAVYDDKVRAGTTELTRIHHRGTALFLMQGRADAGVLWRSEAMFHEQAGHPLGHVDIPAAQNATEIYAGALVKDAPHPEAARQWLAFLRSPDAFRIFQRYGFGRYDADAGADTNTQAEQTHP
ncbi:molybdate ABC transporter substrate-binding protein [Burkholderia stagnalis]|uniref:Glycine/betaine ABC transporter substrate-binding protein n=1 Tax=Burkholderia stagnalis TaxID=1503054 RepID=A0A107AIB0_9BURK|nr:substrate-binding domain-containing protein [Burkholderia stagnalis]KVZ17559.1 glycine/betaine ABC transporter substrate-binding protein [Burkholderia stagnalis]KWA60296.1 glycine/betaine ABC transporter substrate-binding protein [Burkholderia stagnalis]KWA61859.1 glycine/betaine ABC transporter substrate-binding protein [Burkholderia stagnalis]KWA66321.1 glycine/betaine ABC transporter substrate-binding protein [Burkholderia stagnalis]KWD02185.1 glycine/betaine ABC transporter substrate-bi